MQQLCGAEPVREAAQRFGDHSGSNLAGLMTAGAVGDRPHAEIGTIDKAVLVPRANRADMGRRPGVKPPRGQ